MTLPQQPAFVSILEDTGDVSSGRGLASAAVRRLAADYGIREGNSVMGCRLLDVAFDDRAVEVERINVRGQTGDLPKSCYFMGKSCGAMRKPPHGVWPLF